MSSAASCGESGSIRRCGGELSGGLRDATLANRLGDSGCP